MTSVPSLLALFALIFMSSPEASNAEAKAETGTEISAQVCPVAEDLYGQGDYSAAISEINQCLMEDLTSEERACALLHRAQNYKALGADDKAAGDRDSALAADGALSDAETAVACLGIDETEAAQLLELEGF